ncbi:MAG: VanZ family protein [Planctomycetota bacterium]
MQPLTKIRVFQFRLAVILLTIYWIAMFTGTHLPKMGIINVHVNDKVKHFIGFFGLTFLLCYVSGGEHLWRRFARVVGIILTYALFDEWTQGFVPGRTPDPMDFLADALGMFAAIGMYLAARRFFHKPILRMLSRVRGLTPG